MAESRLKTLHKAADIYGARSFDNYAQIRSVAEQLREGLSKWMDEKEECVFLVPPQGAFQAQNYRSAAFSVSGKGFLPLEPISFGLAVQVSGDGDYMRLVTTCRKEGDSMFIQIEDGDSYELPLPIESKNLEGLYETVYQHLMEWFEGRVAQYDDGDYGSNDIGFDIVRVELD